MYKVFVSVKPLNLIRRLSKFTVLVRVRMCANEAWTPLFYLLENTSIHMDYNYESVLVSSRDYNLQMNNIDNLKFINVIISGLFFICVLTFVQLDKLFFKLNVINFHRTPKENCAIIFI